MNDKKGECRMNTEIELNVNDYLDLYLFAGDLGETIWQLEIIEQLEALTTEKPLKRGMGSPLKEPKRRKLYPSLTCPHSHLPCLIGPSIS